MAKKKESKDTKRGKDRLESEKERAFLPIEHLDGPTGVYANHFVLTRDGDSYYLTFYQIVPPTLLGNQEQIESQLRKIASVKAVPVARIVLSEPHFSKLIDMMRGHPTERNEDGNTLDIEKPE